MVIQTPSNPGRQQTRWALSNPAGCLAVPLLHAICHIHSFASARSLLLHPPALLTRECLTARMPAHAAHCVWTSSSLRLLQMLEHLNMFAMRRCLLSARQSRTRLAWQMVASAQTSPSTCTGSRVCMGERLSLFPSVRHCVVQMCLRLEYSCPCSMLPLGYLPVTENSAPVGMLPR